MLLCLSIMEIDSPDSMETTPSLTRPRLEAARAAIITAATLLFGVFSLAGSRDIAWAGQWLLLAAPACAYIHFFLWRRLPRNRPGEGLPLLSTLGSGTQLSLARGILLGLVFGFLAGPLPIGVLSWVPASLYTLAVLSDYFDGYLARIKGNVTLLGADLDMELDALGMLVGVALAIHHGALSYWFLPIGLARYAFVFGMWALRRAGKPLHELPPSMSRRPVAGLTTGFLSVMLWPIVRPPASTLAGVLFLMPFLASFLRDWFVVRGVVDPASKGYLEIRDIAKTVLTDWIPLSLRGLLVGGLLQAGLWGGPASPDRIAELAAMDIPSPELVVSVFWLIEAVGLVLILFGVAGRAASLVLLFPQGLTILAAGLTPVRAMALAAMIGILYLGTGIASLWQPEKSLFARRAGERSGG